MLCRGRHRRLRAPSSERPAERIGGLRRSGGVGPSVMRDAACFRRAWRHHGKTRRILAICAGAARRRAHVPRARHRPLRRSGVCCGHARSGHGRGLDGCAAPWSSQRTATRDPRRGPRAGASDALQLYIGTVAKRPLMHCLPPFGSVHASRRRGPLPRPLPGHTPCSLVRAPKKPPCRRGRGPQPALILSQPVRAALSRVWY